MKSVIMKWFLKCNLYCIVIVLCLTCQLPLDTLICLVPYGVEDEHFKNKRLPTGQLILNKSNVLYWVFHVNDLSRLIWGQLLVGWVWVPFTEMVILCLSLGGVCVAVCLVGLIQVGLFRITQFQQVKLKVTLALTGISICSEITRHIKNYIFLFLVSIKGDKRINNYLQITFLYIIYTFTSFYITLF